MSTFMEEIAQGHVFELLLIIPRVNNIVCMIYNDNWRICMSGLWQQKWDIIIYILSCNVCYNIDKKIKYINQSRKL